MNNKLIIILAFLCFLSGYFYMNNNIKDKPSYSFSKDVDKMDTSSYSKLYKDENLIIVNILGEINKPDMYLLERGATLKDIVQIAGGAVEDADLNSLDMDRKLLDKETIIVPKIKKNKEENNYKDLININKADKETLKIIPGVGDAIAQNIIDYRENISLFYSISDIKNVDKIGEKLFQKIKNFITVD